MAAQQTAVALYTYTPVNWDELAVNEGDVVELVDDWALPPPEQGWTRARVLTRPAAEVGLVPLNYLEMRAAAQTPPQFEQFPGAPDKPPPIDKAAKPKSNFFSLRRLSRNKEQMLAAATEQQVSTLTRSKSTDNMDDLSDDVMSKRPNKSVPSLPVDPHDDAAIAPPPPDKKKKQSSFALTAMLMKKRATGGLPEPDSSESSPMPSPHSTPVTPRSTHRRSRSDETDELKQASTAAEHTAQQQLRPWFKGYKDKKNTLTDVFNVDFQKANPEAAEQAIQAYEAENGDDQDPQRFRSWFVKYKDKKPDMFAVDFERTVQQKRADDATAMSLSPPPGALPPIPMGALPSVPQQAPVAAPQAAPAPLVAQPSIMMPSNNPSAVKLWFNQIEDENEREALLRGLSKEEKHFQQAAYEIYVTEMDYVEDLRIIIEHFLKPIQEKQLLKPKNVETLFSNVEVLLGVNEYFLGEIERVMDETTLWPLIQRISDAFLQSMDYFPHYTEYCCNHPEAVELMKRKMEDKGSFAKFLKETSAKKECKGLTLESFLIKPIQRICKYPLLIRELLRNCSETHEDHANLLKAAEKMEAVVTEVNERMKDAERFDKMQDIASKIKSDEPLDIVDNDRKLVMEGNTTAVENGKATEPRYVVLFNDKVLVTKPIRSLVGAQQYKLLVEIPISSLAVNDFIGRPLSPVSPISGEDNNVDKGSMFELIKLSRSQYAQHMAYRMDAGIDINRWLTEFDKLKVSRNPTLEVTQSRSEKEDLLASLLGKAIKEDAYEDPLEKYRREQEETFRREREAQAEVLRKQQEEQLRRQQEEARRQAEESKRLAEENAKRKIEEAQRQMEESRRQDEARLVAQAEENARRKIEEAKRQMDDAKRQAEDRFRQENERLRQENEQLKSDRSRFEREKVELDVALAVKPLPTPPMGRRDRSGTEASLASTSASSVTTNADEELRHQQRLQAIRSNIAKSSGPKAKPQVPQRNYYHGSSVGDKPAAPGRPAGARPAQSGRPPVPAAPASVERSGTISRPVVSPTAPSSAATNPSPPAAKKERPPVPERSFATAGKPAVADRSQARPPPPVISAPQLVSSTKPVLPSRPRPGQTDSDTSLVRKASIDSLDLAVSMPRTPNGGTATLNLVRTGGVVIAAGPADGSAPAKKIVPTRSAPPPPGASAGAAGAGRPPPPPISPMVAQPPSQPPSTGRAAMPAPPPPTTSRPNTAQREADEQRAAADKAREEAADMRKQAEDERREAERIKREAQDLKAAAERARTQLEREKDNSSTPAPSAIKTRQPSTGFGSTPSQSSVSNVSNNFGKRTLERNPADRQRREEEERQRNASSGVSSSNDSNPSVDEARLVAMRAEMEAMKQEAERARREADEARAYAEQLRREVSMSARK